jgi:hypothetical protein
MLLSLTIAYKAPIIFFEVVLVGYVVMSEKVCILNPMKKVVYCFVFAAVVDLS